MSKYAYVRVSTDTQNPDRQIEAMLKLGIDRDLIIVEVGSGKDFQRPKWKMLRGILKAGDTLYLDEVSRLGRNYDEVIDEWKSLERNKGVSIVCLNPSCMSTDNFRAMGPLGKVYEDNMLSLLAYVAESERRSTLERQREGIELAKANHIYKGRARKPVPDGAGEIFARVAGGALRPSYGAKALGMTYITFWRRLSEWKGTHTVKLPELAREVPNRSQTVKAEVVETGGKDPYDYLIASGAAVSSEAALQRMRIMQNGDPIDEKNIEGPKAIGDKQEAKGKEDKRR